MVARSIWKKVRRAVSALLWLWLRWHRPRGRIIALKRLGVKGRVLGMAYSGLGAWAIARHWVMHQALKTKTLNRYGFTIPWDFAASGN